MGRLLGTILPLGAALLCLPLAACSFTFFYRAEAIEGWVVDAETGKRLEGVIVLAHWLLKGGPERGNPVGELMILESVTDQTGRYSFPAWGPKFAFIGKLESESPELLLFKRGYRYERLQNYHWYPGLDTSKSDWNGKTVKLKPFTGGAREYANHLSFLNGDLLRIGHDDEPCGWKSFPRLIGALDAQDAEFRRAGINYGSIASSLRSNDSRLIAAGCGSIKEALGP